MQKNCTFVTVAWLQACARSQTKVATLEFEIGCYDIFLASLVDSHLVRIDSNSKKEGDSSFHYLEDSCGRQKLILSHRFPGHC